MGLFVMVMQEMRALCGGGGGGDDEVRVATKEQ